MRMMINALGIIPVKTDSCPKMGDYAISKKMNIAWGKHKRGDIVLFDFNRNGISDHIGIVLSVNKDGSITTIEGNTGSGNNTNGGQVQKRTRYKKQVNYFIRPKYNSAITADMVLATAMAEVGTKESPKNSNKVKYNAWFYGKNTSAFWCCTFICWLFAHVEDAQTIVVVKKPSGKYSGSLSNTTLKKGSKGSAVKLLQKFLNWYHPAWKLIVDGKFGDKTRKALLSFQKTEKLTVDGIFGKKSYKKAMIYVAQKKAVKTKTTKQTVAIKPHAKAVAAVAWARKIAKSKKYTYKKWNNKKKNTKLCPICHPGSGNGWNCIGFVSACWHHGAKLPVACSCKGLGTDSFFTKVTLESWIKRNGKGWKLITNGGSKGGADISVSKLVEGDILICYDGKGKFHHIVLYTGNGKYIDCTNTSKNHIAERNYSVITKKYHVTRAFRYVG